MKAQTMRRLRQFHHYVGIFLTPAILFFALSGALQTIGLHENHDPSGPPPAPWIAWMASIHKDQTTPRAKHAPAAGEAHDHMDGDDHEHADHDHAAKPSHDGPPDQRPSPIPLKAFVLLLALGLMASSLLGVTIALTNRATRRTSLIALAAGTLLPLILLYL